MADPSRRTLYINMSVQIHFYNVRVYMHGQYNHTVTACLVLNLKKIKYVRFVAEFAAFHGLGRGFVLFYPLLHLRSSSSSYLRVHM